MRPFRQAHPAPAVPSAGRRVVAEPLGYELVDFKQQPINLYVTELTYCEPHWHEPAEFIMVLSGAFEVLLRNRSLRLKKGGMVYVPGDDLHTVHPREDRSVLLGVQFSPALHGVCGAGRERSRVLDELHPQEPAHQDLLAAVADLARHVFQHEPVFGDYTLLKRVFALLEAVQLVSRSSAALDDTDISGGGGDRQIEIAKRAIAYSNDHYLEDIKLLDVAAAMGVSYHHLSHTFKAVSGFSFREYLTLLRVNKARELLRDETLNITRVSSGSGFSEHKHLDAAFQKYFATTPTQYRKKYMNQLLVCREAASDGVNRLLTPAEVESYLQGMNS
ncbi:MAG TPA: helix-turn-helix domain-containing protein [Steroidobacteraceae bacterium]|nr:helix-turn-helix domain-containing protein [Steroidobacteraceae bacterium]